MGGDKAGAVELAKSFDYPPILVEACGGISHEIFVKLARGEVIVADGAVPIDERWVQLSGERMLEGERHRPLRGFTVAIVAIDYMWTKHPLE